MTAASTKQTALPVGITAHVSPAMMSRHAMNSGYVMRVTPLTKEAARELAPRILDQFSTRAGASCLGYANTAAVVSSELGTKVPHNRASVSLEVGDSVLLCHLSGARLPEFASTLPDETHLQFFIVTFDDLVP